MSSHDPAPLPRRRPTADPTLGAQAQPVQRFSAVPPGPSRRPGLPLPVWILGGAVVLVLVVGAAVILPRLGAAPTEPAGAGELVGGTTTTSATASADPSGSPSASAAVTPSASSSTAVPGAPELVISDFRSENLGIELDHGLKAFRIRFKIFNPGTVAQTWDSVAVTVNRNTFPIFPLADKPAEFWTSAVDQLACAGPKIPSVGRLLPNQEITVEFTVGSLGDQPPVKANPALNHPDCHAPQAS